MVEVTAYREVGAGRRTRKVTHTFKPYEGTGYHITRPSNIASIFENGLVPQIGKRSQTKNEQKPMVYYSPDKDGIREWKFMFDRWLGKDTSCLSFDISKLDPKSIEWKEYTADIDHSTSQAIPPEMLSIVRNGKEEPLASFDVWEREVTSDGIKSLIESADKTKGFMNTLTRKTNIDIKSVVENEIRGNASTSVERLKEYGFLEGASKEVVDGLKVHLKKSEFAGYKSLLAPLLGSSAIAEDGTHVVENKVYDNFMAGEIDIPENFNRIGIDEVLSLVEQLKQKQMQKQTHGGEKQH